MRPIDANALAVQIRDNVFHDFTDEFWGVMQCIMEAPTIESECKTGRWIKMSDAYRTYYCCSECGEERNRTKFCPDCGAKMEGENNERSD